MSKDAPYLDQYTLQRILHYAPDTGVFTWLYRTDQRKAWNTRYAGKVAGYDWSIGKVAYRSIRIFDWPFLGHRLAWLYMTGEWPANDIDHIDMNGLNNRWTNLRAATKSQNAANTRAPSNSKTGVKGVGLDSAGRGFRAYITIGRRQKWLGYFETVEEAAAARASAAVAIHGEFARSS